MDIMERSRGGSSSALGPPPGLRFQLRRCACRGSVAAIPEPWVAGGLSASGSLQGAGQGLAVALRHPSSTSGVDARRPRRDGSK